MIMDGFCLINKPKGKTSRQVSDYIGKLFHTKKVGHIGTLDPFASGLLIVAVNKGCKAIPYVKDDIKTYEATLKLGEKTSSGDIEGEVIESKDVPTISLKDIEVALKSFLGKSLQIPPMTSAIRVNGQRLYELAHKGVEIERKPREIEVYDISLISYDNKSQLVRFIVKVSKGTYIRVLGEDIATKLNTVGHLTNLTRLAVDDISIKEAEELSEEMSVHSVYEILSRNIRPLIKDDKTIEDIKNGKVKYLEYDSQDEEIMVVSSINEVVAIYGKGSNNRLEFKRGLF